MNMKYCTIRDGGDEKGTVFILHGAFADRTAQDRLAEIIHQKGYTVICCDARGHGENEGRIHEWKKTVQEYNKRIKKHPSEQIIVIGHSMGGTQAISLTKNPKVSQVFSISPAHNSGPFDNMNILSRLFFAANIEPKKRGKKH